MQFLTDKTQLVYNSIAEFKLLNEFTFVGGSAIAFYLQHRLSEDLDFFTWQKELPIDLQTFLREISKKHKIEIYNSSSTYLDVFIDDIKITFFANDWEVLKTYRTKCFNNIYAAELKLLSAMKINTLSLRAKYRDYYDLYVINKEIFSLKELYEHSTFYLPGMTKKVFGTVLTFIADIEDEKIEHLNPKYKVTIEDIQTHFDKEIVKIF